MSVLDCHYWSVHLGVAKRVSRLLISALISYTLFYTHSYLNLARFLGHSSMELGVSFSRRSRCAHVCNDNGALAPFPFISFPFLFPCRSHPVGLTLYLRVLSCMCTPTKQTEQTDKTSYCDHLHTLFISQEIMQKTKIDWTTNNRVTNQDKTRSIVNSR